MAPPLSERERRFVEAYMGEAAGNGTVAAQLAGYKGKAATLAVQAARLLIKANVASALETKREALASQSIADAKERRERLTKIQRTSDNEGAVIKAIDTQNKMDALYVAKSEVTLNVPAAVTFVIQVQAGATCLP